VEEMKGRVESAGSWQPLGASWPRRENIPLYLVTPSAGSPSRHLYRRAPRRRKQNCSSELSSRPGGPR